MLQSDNPHGSTWTRRTSEISARTVSECGSVQCDLLTQKQVTTNKRFGFPETLDLGCMLTKQSGRVVDALYDLHAVVARRDTRYSIAEYTAFVRDHASWYLADDVHVRKCSWKDVKTTYEAGWESHSGVAYMVMYLKRYPLYCPE